MKGFPNFLLLFERIGNYLAKGPKGSQKELNAAREAFKTMVKTFYGGKHKAPCDTEKTHIVIFH